MDKNQEAFFALLRAGLFPVHGEGGMVHDSSFKDVDWEKVYLLAQEQSVQGLVLQGIETVQGSWLKVHGSPLVPKVLLLQWIGEVQVIEQRNKEMNVFVADLIEKLRKQDVNTLLVKGQGVAQCYEKPLWRTCGDIDLFLSDDNYEKAKTILIPLASKVETEAKFKKHLGMTIDGWVVELHGSLGSGLSKRVDRVLGEIKDDTFYGGNVSSWNNNGVQVFMLAHENNAVYVFSHILDHFYKGGIGLRQICDWCRLLWTYRDTLNHKLLESRIKKAGLMTEWKAFGTFAVKYLGMDSEYVPFLGSTFNIQCSMLSKKAEKIKDFVMEVGNFGHNRDNSYYAKHPFLIRKIYSFGRRCGDLFRHARIFPLDSLRFFPYMMYNGIKAALNGVHND